MLVGIDVRVQCVLKPQAFVLSMSTCIIVCSVHASIDISDYDVYRWVSICVPVCVCTSVYTWALFRPRVFNSSECGCVHPDAVWWSECQYCSRLPVMFCFAAVCFVKLLPYTFVCLCLCFFFKNPAYTKICPNKWRKWNKKYISTKNPSWNNWKCNLFFVLFCAM